MVVKEDANVLKVLLEQSVKSRVLALLWSQEFLFKVHIQNPYPGGGGIVAHILLWLIAVNKT
jgi:hypothetical protein